MALCPSVCSSQVAAQPITVVCKATRVYMPILGGIAWTFYHLLCKNGWTDRRQSLKPTPIHAKCSKFKNVSLKVCCKHHEIHFTLCCLTSCRTPYWYLYRHTAGWMGVHMTSHNRASNSVNRQTETDECDIWGFGELCRRGKPQRRLNTELSVVKLHSSLQCIFTLCFIVLCCYLAVNG